MKFRPLVTLTSLAVLGTALALSGSAFAEAPTPTWTQSPAPAGASAYSTDHARITFHADTPMQAIDATATDGVFTYNAQTGEFSAKVGIASFKFQNAQMETNFQTGHIAVNEPGPKDAAGQPSYPNKFATLTGKLEKPVAVGKDGAQEVVLKGKLTLHGVSKDISAKGTVTSKGADLLLASKVEIAPKDFNIPLPKLGDRELGAVIVVSVDATLTAKP